MQLLPRAGAGLPLREGGQRHRGAHRRLPAGEGHAATGRRAYPHAQGQGIRPGRAAEGAVPLGNAVRPGDGRTESRRRRGGLLRPDGPLPAGTDAHAARAGGHHVGNPGRHGIHARTPPRSRTAARGRGYRRRARRGAGFRHRKGRRPPRVRRVQHLHPTLLRPALAGPLHQRESGGDRRIHGDRGGHERRDAPRVLRHPAAGEHPESGLSGADLRGGVLRHARLGDPPAGTPRGRACAGSRRSAPPGRSTRNTAN